MAKAIPFKLIKKTDLQKISLEVITLKSRIESATEFIKSIENGDFDAQYKQDQEALEVDILANSLTSLRDQLITAAKKEKQRNWIAETRSKFMDILRNGNEDLIGLGNNIIGSLVKHLKSNQGGLYLVNDDNQKDIHIELVACYAFDRKKFVSQRIEIGQGLVGQAILEKGTIYMTDIPDDYIKITSGLGDANPKNLLIVPLKIEENVFGVIEMASFRAFETYEIGFVEQLGEIIASTISSAKINMKTRKLLEESQAQTEEMRAQEEEMRQNMEELAATQEEMNRVLLESQYNESFNKGIMNASKDSIMVIDRDYNLLNFNESFLATNRDVKIGLSILSALPKEMHQEYKGLYDKVFDGDSFERRDYLANTGTTYFSSYHPLKNEKGEIFAAAIFAKDISELARAQAQTEKLLSESQEKEEQMKAQEEEMKQSLEEITATQEEMERVMMEAQQSENFTRQILNASKDSIVVIDKAYNLLNFNDNFSKTNESLKVGSSILEVLPKEMHKEYQKLYDKVFDGKSFERRDHLANTDTTYLSAYNPLKDEKGEVFAAVIFAKDISELARAQAKTEKLLMDSQEKEEQLKAQEEEMRQNLEELSATQEEMDKVINEVRAKEFYSKELLAASKDSILVIDKKYNLMDFNAVVVQSGLDIKRGDSIFNLIPPDKKEHHKKIYDRALKGEQFEIQENVGDKYYLSSYSPLKDEKGNITSVAIFAKDITELMVAQKELERLLKSKK